MWTAQDITIELIGWEHCGRHWRWDRKQWRRNSYDLWCVADGIGFVNDGVSEVEIGPGDVLLYPPEPGFMATQDSEHRLIVGYIYYHVKNDRLLKEWLNLSEHRFARWKIEEREWMATLFRKCWACDQPSRNWRASPWIPKDAGIEPSLSKLWLAGILNELAALAPDHSVRAYGRDVSGINEKLDALCDRIRTSPQYRWQAEEMAAQLGWSASHLNRVFRQYLGISPRAFVIQARLDRAKALLMFSELSIGQIAEQLGYADQFSFSKQFRKELGASPSEWRLKRP